MKLKNSKLMLKIADNALQELFKRRDDLVEYLERNSDENAIHLSLEEREFYRGHIDPLSEKIAKLISFFPPDYWKRGIVGTNPYSDGMMWEN